MKLINIIFLIGMVSCKKNTNEINKEQFSHYIAKDKAIILSCFRCDCIPSFFSSNHGLFNSIDNINIYADSNCYGNKIEVKYIHLSQNKIDSIFLKNYNAILIKRNGDNLDYKILKTEESNKFSNTILDFFND